MLGADDTRPLAVSGARDDAATRSAIIPAPRASVRSGAGTRGQAPFWPGAERRSAHTPVRRRTGWLARGLAGLALSLVVLAAMSVVLWLMLLRPYLHARADGAISAALNQAIATLPVIPDQAFQVISPTVSISDVETNALLAHTLPSGTGVDQLSATFQTNALIVTYHAYGQQGTIETGLQAQNGQLIATDTRVSGPLGWVESGDELRATLNQALGELAAKTPHGFQGVRIAPGQLTVTLKTS